MGKVLSFFDGLRNSLTGAGTSVDPRGYATWDVCPYTEQQIVAAYRASWLMRKGIDLPPYDMTRAWRDWKADSQQIEALEAEERRLDLQTKVRQALVLGRLGGGAIILGINQGSPGQPLDRKRIGQGALTYAVVMSRWQLSLDGGIIKDPANPLFGGPAFFVINAADGSQARIHPSRIVCFKGQQVPGNTYATPEDEFWGDSMVQTADAAVKNATMAMDGFSGLISSAKEDIIGIPGLTSNFATAEYQQLLMSRLQTAAIGKSTHRALIIDSGTGQPGTGETWEQRQITWTGMPEIGSWLVALVASAFDIPATRFLGKSPDGMNATGKSDSGNYDQMIAGKQENELAPLLDQIDAVLIPSALGTVDPNIYFEFAPLSVPTEAEQAEIANKKALTTKIYADSGLIPTIALEKGVQNQLVEDGTYPGLDGALAELTEAERFPSQDPANDIEDPNAIVDPNAGGGDPNLRRRVAANDAVPRALYVSRKLINAAEFIEWAKGQGFTTTTPADEIRVTITFSRTPVDWMTMGSDGWGSDGKGNLEVVPGGARIVEKLGDKGAAVLLFASSSLSWRHEEMVRNGASFDFSEYQPHVTITYEYGDLDLSKVEPYRGKLVFGPEIFAEVVDDWEKSVTEK